MAQHDEGRRRPARARAVAAAVLTTLVTALASVAAPAAAALPEPEGGPGSYSLRFPIAGIPAFDVDDVVPELNRDFDKYFTFAGCGSSIVVGEVCELQAAPGVAAPVEVIAVEDDGFTFRSLPGHPEGADRFINFRFRAADVQGNATRKELAVDAWGPTAGASRLGPLNAQTVARTSWQIFANNVNDGFPDEPVVTGGAI